MVQVVNVVQVVRVARAVRVVQVVQVVGGSRWSGEYKTQVEIQIPVRNLVE